MSEAALAYVEMLQGQLTPCEYRLLLALASLAEPPTHAVQITKRRLHELTGVSLEYVGTCLRNLASRSQWCWGLCRSRRPRVTVRRRICTTFPALSRRPVLPRSSSISGPHRDASSAHWSGGVPSASSARCCQIARQLEDQLAASSPARTGT